MAHLIDKDALVAEITKRKQWHEEMEKGWASSSHFWTKREDEEIISIINTLEVKEVDLEKEIDDIFQKYKNGYNGLLICKKSDFSLIAKHFFELGIKAVQKEE